MELGRIYKLTRAASYLTKNIHTSPRRDLLPVKNRPIYIKGVTAIKENPSGCLTVNLLPLWRGQTKQGVRYGPAVILSKVQELTQHDIQANFVADYTLNNKITADNFLTTMSSVSRDLGGIEDDGLILNIGGDHAIPMMTIPIMLEKHPNLKVIWIDAHADINSPESSPSGNYHGMPVFFLSSASGEPDGNVKKLSLDNLVYVGVREVDPTEEKLMEQYQIRNYKKAEINDRGIQSVVGEIIQKLELHKNPVHISFDIDALDPALAPSTGTKVPNGLSVEDVVRIFREIKKTANLVSCDIVEFNPLIGSDEDVETTIESIAPVLRAICNSY